MKYTHMVLMNASAIDQKECDEEDVDTHSCSPPSGIRRDLHQDSGHEARNYEVKYYKQPTHVL